MTGWSSVNDDAEGVISDDIMDCDTFYDDKRPLACGERSGAPRPARDRLLPPIFVLKSLYPVCVTRAGLGETRHPAYRPSLNPR